MRFGVFCFILLFLGTELYHWLAGLGQFELSLPMTIVAGGGLAIASNLRAPQPNSPERAPKTQPAPAEADAAPTKSDRRPTPDTISFTVSPPFQSD